MPSPTTLRRDLAGLAGLAERDLYAIAARVPPGRLEDALRAALPGLVDTYGSAAALLAAEWYDAERAAQGVAGRFSADPRWIEDPGTDALVGWASWTATDDAAFRALIAGGVQRRIADFGRGTIIGSALADPGADGWQRFGVGSSCAFCRMLIGRGAVYSEASVRFGAHDKCNCTATVAWSDRPRAVQPFKPSQRGTSDADQARAREWIKGNL